MNEVREPVTDLGEYEFAAKQAYVDAEAEIAGKVEDLAEENA